MLQQYCLQAGKRNKLTKREISIGVTQLKSADTENKGFS
jgi:hypothetical protein